jgi:hypothetical protein
MNKADLAILVQEVQTLRAETAAHLQLAASLAVKADRILERLPIKAPPTEPATPNGHGVEFNGATWRRIAAAIEGLGPRKAALIRQWLVRGGRPVHPTKPVEFRLEA